jgi:hypothetical protein
MTTTNYWYAILFFTVLFEIIFLTFSVHFVFSSTKFYLISPYYFILFCSVLISFHFISLNLIFYFILQNGKDMIETSNKSKSDILLKENEDKEYSEFYGSFLDMIRSDNKKAEQACTVRTSMTNRDDRLLSQGIVKQARKDFLNLRKFVSVEKDKREKEKEREKGVNGGIEKKSHSVINKIDRIQLNKKDVDKEKDRDREGGRDVVSERGRKKGKNRGKGKEVEKERDREVLDFTLGGDQSW